ncbi:hypothetical protein [Synechococcus sp. PCC 7335]|uniref:hypothetical protein n=1 Tax=Synechococcus sp. (strain ATCC 29403 / PCC 7335) TaxID=91464 RepID=UPI0003050DAE|nr:hypothetical protein [Synechococcus sp. PCC 7335]
MCLNPHELVTTPFGRASKNVITVKGEVIDVYEVTAQPGNRSGTHLLLKTNGDFLEVRLGPSWYLEEKDFSQSQATLNLHLS